ncbi:hypothetical protein JCM19046_3779 [Bacillus sp. JCM 19046]|nr:hypothetical protein JCM19046_3779 [Bacillus sp. JCM 19046]
MKSFIFYLKRDLRLLLPLNLILFLVIVLGMGSVLILRMNISRPLETIDFSVIAFFLFFLMLVGGLIISVEALWREWRLGTQFGWYLSQGTLHLKLWSKVIAIYLWQGVQLLLTLFLFFGVAYLTSTQATVNEMLNELRLPSPFLLQLIWSTFIVPLSSIMMILLAAFLYFGLKTKWRLYIWVVLYFGCYFISVHLFEI